MPRAVPMNSTSASNCFLSCWAMASAGMTCPPVPPPAMMTRMLNSKIYHGDTEARRRRLDECLRAMSLALKHAHIGAPRTNFLTVLVRHHPGELMDVCQVVGRP